jgi:hypothetical protein
VAAVLLKLLPWHLLALSVAPLLLTLRKLSLLLLM